MTSMSGSSPSGASTMMARLRCTLAMSISSRSTGLPERQTTLVPFVDGMRARISSSIWILSRSASTTMLRPRWLAFAPMSSARIVKTCWFQPRITVWSDSITRDLPLRSSARRSWMPVLMMPMRALITKMPPRVTASIAPRNPGRP